MMAIGIADCAIQQAIVVELLDRFHDLLKSIEKEPALTISFLSPLPRWDRLLPAGRRARAGGQGNRASRMRRRRNTKGISDNVFSDRKRAPDGPNRGPGSRKTLMSLDSGFRRSDECKVVQRLLNLLSFLICEGHVEMAITAA